MNSYKSVHLYGRLDSYVCDDCSSFANTGSGSVLLLATSSTSGLAACPLSQKDSSIGDEGCHLARADSKKKKKITLRTSAE